MWVCKALCSTCGPPCRDLYWVFQVTNKFLKVNKWENLLHICFYFCFFKVRTNTTLLLFIKTQVQYCQEKYWNVKTHCQRHSESFSQISSFSETAFYTSFSGNWKSCIIRRSVLLAQPPSPPGWLPLSLSPLLPHCSSFTGPWAAGCISWSNWWLIASYSHQRNLFSLFLFLFNLFRAK